MLNKICKICGLSVIALIVGMLQRELCQAEEKSNYKQWLEYKNELCKDPNLVAYYDFEEGEGTILKNKAVGPSGDTAYKPEELNGTIQGATWTTGRWSEKKALSFDGAEDCVDFGDMTELDGLSQLTVKIWFKPSTLPFSGVYIFHRGSFPEGNITLEGTGNSSTLSVMMANSDKNYVRLRTTDTVISGWNYFAVTWDGATVVMYLNGKIQSAIDSLEGTFKDVGPLRLGQIKGYTKGHWAGLIDEFVIYNRALSENEIRQDYETSFAPTTEMQPSLLPPSKKKTEYEQWLEYKNELCKNPNLVAYYDFEDGKGTILKNKAIGPSGDTAYKPDKLNGTIQGATWTTGRWSEKKALSFDGVDDYVDCGKATSLDITEAITIEAWVYPAGGDWFSLKDMYPIVTKGGMRGGGYTLLVYPAMSSGGIEREQNTIYFSWGDATAAITRGGIFKAPGWRHIAVTHTGKVRNIYLNGEKIRIGKDGEEEYDVRKASVVPEPLKIGGPYTTVCWNGSIDEVAIYNKALREEEIKHHYEMGRVSFPRDTGLSLRIEVKSLTSEKSNLASVTLGKEWARLQKGIPTRWIDLDPLLAKAKGDDKNLIEFIFKVSSGEIEHMALKMDFAFPLDYKIIKSLEEEYWGSEVGLFLPALTTPRQEVVNSIMSFADYYNPYWQKLEALKLPVIDPSKLKIIFPCRLYGNDSSKRYWTEGIRAMSRFGFNTIAYDAISSIPPKRLRELMCENNIPYYSIAIYGPPSMFDFDVGERSALYHPVYPDSYDFDGWANKFRDKFIKAGMDPAKFIYFPIRDEPGWYFPEMTNYLNADPKGLASFHIFLKKEGFAPADFGKKSWEEVQAIGCSQAIDLPSKKLFYWSVNYVPKLASNMMRLYSESIQKAFSPAVNITMNWGNFGSWYYEPGDFGNNLFKGSPDAARGSFDWIDGGRRKSVNCLWTEDWEPDSWGYVWSYYANTLRCAAAQKGIKFGGYVVGKLAGQHQDGMLKKSLCLIGNGAKVLDYYMFGPRRIAIDGWSDNFPVYEPIARSTRMIAKADDLLYAGQKRPPQVAILLPQSSQVWDFKVLPLLKTKEGEVSMLCYRFEVLSLYYALMHANIPADFVDEIDLDEGKLSKYKVLYITPPNLHRKAQEKIKEWVKEGGTLVGLSNSGQFDEYNEPTHILDEVWGVRQKDRLPAVGIDKAKVVDTVKMTTFSSVQALNFPAYGFKGDFTPTTAETLATFSNGEPAITRNQYGKGKVFLFGAAVGAAYWRSAAAPTVQRLPEDFSSDIRKCITDPVKQSRVDVPVILSKSCVEAPLLESEEGVVVTLINWNNGPIEDLEVTIKDVKGINKVSSAVHGDLKFQQVDNGISFSLPLNSADIISLREE